MKIEREIWAGVIQLTGMMLVVIGSELFMEVGFLRYLGFPLGVYGWYLLKVGVRKEVLKELKIIKN